MCNAAGRYTPPTTRFSVHVRALRADQPIRTDVHLRQPVGRRTGQDHGPASETAEPRPEIDFRSAVYACINHTCDYKSIISSSCGCFFPRSRTVPGKSFRFRDGISSHVYYFSLRPLRFWCVISFKRYFLAPFPRTNQGFSRLRAPSPSVVVFWFFFYDNFSKKKKEKARK